MPLKTVLAILVVMSLAGCGNKAKYHINQETRRQLDGYELSTYICNSYGDKILNSWCDIDVNTPDSIKEIKYDKAVLLCDKLNAIDTFKIRPSATPLKYRYKGLEYRLYIVRYYTNRIYWH